MSRFRLPAEAHVPGVNARPGPELTRMAAEAPAVTDPDAWAENGAWLHGIALYNAGFFWEAHELWEPVWMRAAPNSAARAMVAGVIHLTNACLKLRMNRPRAATRLIALSRGEIAPLKGRVMGLDVALMLPALDGFAEMLGATSEAARPILCPVGPA